MLAVYHPVHREVAIAVGEQCQHPREFGAQGGCSFLGESFGRFDSLSLGDEFDDQAQLFLFTEVFTQVFSACGVVAPTIAIIPTLIAAGSVDHDVMTAIKLGSAGDECASLSISTALATARYAWHVDLSGVRTPAGSTSLQLDFNKALKQEK